MNVSLGGCNICVMGQRDSCHPVAPFFFYTTPTRRPARGGDGFGVLCLPSTLKPAPRLPLFWRPPPHHPFPADDVAQPRRDVGHPHLDLTQFTPPGTARLGSH